jgi:hypothetical protein
MVQIRNENQRRETDMTAKSRKQLAILAGGVLFLGLSTMAGTAHAQAVDEPGPGTPYSPLPKDKVVVTKVKHFSVACWKIAAGGGTIYFESGKEAGGLTGISSAIDQDGNDWVGADFAGRSTKDFPYTKAYVDCYDHATRGFPKWTYLYGEYETPSKKTGADTKWVDKDGKTIPFTDKLEGDHLIMRSVLEGKFEFEYHFFPSHVAIKVIQAGAIYAFHFQGVIGGEPDSSPQDYVVLKDGKERDISPEMGLLSGTGITGKQIPSPFLYMVDRAEKKTQVLYLGAKNLPATHEDEGWLATASCAGRPKNVIQVFSFGRKPGSYSGYTLSGTDPIFIFGFQPKAAGHDAISAAIEARLADPFNPVNGGTTPGTGGAGGSTATGGSSGTGGGSGGQGGTTGSSGGATGSTGGSAGKSADSGGSTSTGGVTSSGGSSTATGGSSTGSGGASTSTAGSGASGGMKSGGASASGGAGGQVTGSGGSTTGQSKSDGGCTLSHEGGNLGLNLLFVLGVIGLVLRRRKPNA